MTQSIYRVGLENGVEGRSLAWVLGHPGCFAYGADGEAALAEVSQAIQAYGDWIAERGGERCSPTARSSSSWRRPGSATTLTSRTRSWKMGTASTPGFSTTGSP